MALFETKELTFRYPGADKDSPAALEDINLTITPGEFILLCGSSGSGKSTLLRHLKSVLTPHGQHTGQVLYQGLPLDTVDKRTQAQNIGFVLQHPQDQLVTDKVWHELAFGLESLGYDHATIRLRVAEMASFFGIQPWFHRSVQELSGGQVQLLNLASVMAMSPTVLVLDEPTSQLDPIAAMEFLSQLERIHQQLGTTIILSEHRLEEAFPLANRLLVMEKGRIIAQGAPDKIIFPLQAQKSPMERALPAPCRVGAALCPTKPTPMTVQQGKHLLHQEFSFSSYKEREENSLAATGAPKKKETPLLETREVFFRYQKESPLVLRGFDFSVYPGEIVALLGGNGTGKTTALSVLAGLERPYRGQVRVAGKKARRQEDFLQAGIYGLPQDVRHLFVEDTVEKELLSLANPSQHLPQSLSDTLQKMSLEGLDQRHPYDLSGGEQQRLALAKLLLLSPNILLLDEPTQGMDAVFKETFGQLLQSLTQQGLAVVLVSHDIEFCASYAHRCALLFDGEVASQGETRRFFSGNTFYSTAASRMAREIFPGAITTKEVLLKCRNSLPTRTPKVAAPPIRR